MTKSRRMDLAAVKTAMLAKLRDSTITPADVKTLKFEPLIGTKVAQLGLPEAGGFKIPYFNVQGKVTPFFRLRYVEEPLKTGFHAQTTPAKQLRYVQLADTTNLAYFTPEYVDWPEVIKNTDVALVITEGEFKAIATCKLGIPTVGLGGVWNFRAVKKKIDLLPDLAQIKWKHRKVYIAYDSDTINNPQVMLAERVLAEKLVSLGSDVYIVRIPAGANGKKAGLDDYIVEHGKAATLQLFNDSCYQFELSSALHEFNSEVVYIKDPGIIMENQSLLKMTPGAFKEHAYANRFFVEFSTDKNGKLQSQKKQTAPAWLKWEYRAELNRMTYIPGRDRIIPETRELNMWPGWGVESIKGDVRPWKELLDHIFGTDIKARKWFEQWCAYPVQYPGTKLFSAVVIWGLVEGSGKTMIGHTLMKVYGKNAVEIHDTELRDDRNEWAESKQFVLADDITGHSNRELANRLKTLITQKSIRLNPKYIPSYSTPDCINYYFTSNDVDAFFLTDQDRRYFIHEVRAGKPDQTWLRKYLDWRDNGTLGISALRYYLEHQVDLTGFNPQVEAYRTDSKEQMVNLVRTDLGEWVHNLGKEGELYLNGIEQKGELWSSPELLRRYDPEGRSGVKQNGMGRELSKQGFRQLKQVRTQLGMVRLFALRNIEKWEKASTKQIIDHYESTCPELQRTYSNEEATKRKRKY